MTAGAGGEREARPGAGEPGSGSGAPRPPGSVRGLVAASALLVALALAAGLRPGQHWLAELLVVAAMGQGVLAGLTWRRFWRGPAREAFFGAGGRYVGFLAAVAFSAVEAYAVGAGMGREEAPGPVVAIMLAPPLIVAAVALRSAVRHRREREAGTDGPGEQGDGRAGRPRGRPERVPRAGGSEPREQRGSGNVTEMDDRAEGAGS